MLDELYPVVQQRRTFRKSCARKLELANRFGVQIALEGLASGPVFRCRLESKPYFVHAEPAKQNLQTAVLDAPRERPAAHHPGAQIDCAIGMASAQHRDLSQRSELVFVGDRQDKGSGLLHLFAPVRLGVTASVEI